MGVGLSVRHARARLMAAVAAVALVGFACSSQPTPEVLVPTPDRWRNFLDGPFRISIPDWPEMPPSEEKALERVSQAGQSLEIARHEALPRAMGRAFAQALTDHGFDAPIRVDDSDPRLVTVEGRLPAATALRARIHFLYCGGFSYQISGSAPEAAFAAFEPVLDGTLASASCADQASPVAEGPGLIGMVITPKESDFGFPNLRAAAAQARQAGVEAGHLYLQWSDVELSPGEYDWRVADHLIDTLYLEGLRLSLVIEFIHSGIPGSAPADLAETGFEDPAYLERASAFAAAVAARYGNQIDYLALGNEINIYFTSHPEQLELYRNAFTAMRQAVRQVRPDVPIGTVLAFHEMQQARDFSPVEAFRVADFFAYTYYPHQPGFRYDGPTDVFGPVLDEMMEVSNGIPFLVVENGWATAPSLGGTEQLQADYVRATFAALGDRRAAFRRHIWFAMHDISPAECEKLGRTFFSEDFDPQGLGSAWQDFLDYLCTLGLRSSDGTPKLGWQAFVDATSAYRSDG